MDRENGFLGELPFNEDKDNGDGEACDEQANDNSRFPGILVPAPAQRQQQQHDTCEEQERSIEIHSLDLLRERALRCRKFQIECNKGSRDGADGEVDPEGPSPGDMVSECATEERADDGGEGKDSTDHSDVFPALTHVEHIGHDDKHHRHQSTCSNTSHRSKAGISIESREYPLLITRHR